MYPRLPISTKEILFVCTGNLCRSVAAESLAKKNCPPDSSLFIHSAGTDAVRGRQSPQDAVEAGKKRDAPMSAHRAAPLTRDMIKQADALFIMESYHEDRVLSLAPEAKDKVFYLRSFSGDSDSQLTIDDPYSMPMDTYDECFELIEKCVKNLLSEIETADR